MVVAVLVDVNRRHPLVVEKRIDCVYQHYAASFSACSSYTLTRSEAYRLGASVVQNSPVVKRALGAPVSVGKPDSGSLTNALAGDSGTAAMSFPVRGPRGAGHIVLQAARNGGVWRLTHLQLHLEAQTRP